MKQASLPKCPPGKCPTCSTALTDAVVKPYTAMPTRLRTTAFGCLAQCTGCGQRLIGVRSFVRVFAGNYKFLSQSFQPVTPENLAELKALQEYLTAGEQGGEIYLEGMEHDPEHEFVVWFEDMRTSPERAAPAIAAAGFPADALPHSPGVEVVETRDAGDGLLSGIRFRATAPIDARGYAATLRTIARRHGTAAYVRRYAQSEFAVRWDTHAPSPGTRELLERVAA